MDRIHEKARSVKGDHTFRERICEVCGKPFWPANGRERLCSKECKHENRKKRQLEYYYLKTAALATIMAQSICTTLATSYKAKAFRIFSSIALRDNLLGGESYYIVETRSLKRILDAAEAHHPIFCVVDEVLRGTNTVERIAASSEVLQAMAEKRILCLAATHDVELCDLLQESYTMFHFEERVSEDTILFDYMLCKGRASSQNAIALLKLIGFDAKVVERARERANMYIATRSWQK